MKMKLYKIGASSFSKDVILALLFFLTSPWGSLTICNLFICFCIF